MQIVAVVVQSTDTGKSKLVEVNHGDYMAFMEFCKNQQDLLQEPAPEQPKLKTITGTLNFVMQAHTFQDFLNQMDRDNCEILSTNKRFGTYTVTVRGTNNDLRAARWFFRHCGTLL